MRERGYALPQPTEYLLEDLSVARGSGIPFSNMNLDEVKELLFGINWFEKGKLAGALRPRIYTRTGLNRNSGTARNFFPRWSGGAYIEVGGSIGVSAYEIKKAAGFSQAFSLDMMSEEDAGQFLNDEHAEMMSGHEHEETNS